MTNISFRSDVDVKTTRVQGTDLDIALAAWVSTKGERVEDEIDTKRIKGLINMLMRDRHGSPFEQVGFQWLVTAPNFVWWEHVRHRVASYNIESARYTTIDPVFYVPGTDRPLIQTGKPGAYEFYPGSRDQYDDVQLEIEAVSKFCYDSYETLLMKGIAKEIARAVLPVNMFVSGYVSMNLRALMNFISLRTKEEDARVPSFPQYEIELVGMEYEESFADNFPVTYAAFRKNGRIAP